LAVHIRLKRGGQKRQPHYRIVVSDSRSPRDGRFIEIIGFYNPIAKVEEVEIDKARTTYWLANGAQPTDTVKSLLKKKGLWAGLVEDAAVMAKAGTPERPVKPLVPKEVVPEAAPKPVVEEAKAEEVEIEASAELPAPAEIEAPVETEEREPAE